MWSRILHGIRWQSPYGWGKPWQTQQGNLPKQESNLLPKALPGNQANALPPKLRRWPLKLRKDDY